MMFYAICRCGMGWTGENRDELVSMMNISHWCDVQTETGEAIVRVEGRSWPIGWFDLALQDAGGGLQIGEIIDSIEQGRAVSTATDETRTRPWVNQQPDDPPIEEQVQQLSAYIVANHRPTQVRVAAARAVARWRIDNGWGQAADFRVAAAELTDEASRNA